MSFCILLILFVNNIFAQENLNQNTFDLPENEKEEIFVNVKETVGLLNHYIAQMAKKTNSFNVRDEIRKDDALPLFIKKCEPYNEYHNGKVIHNKGVKMQIQSKNDKKPINRLMKEYFVNLINLRYKDVIIKSTEYWRIHCTDPILVEKKDENNITYKVLATFDQYFEGIRNDSKQKGGEIVNKTIECYINRNTILDTNFKKSYEYEIQLGNVRVNHLDSIVDTRLLNIME